MDAVAALREVAYWLDRARADSRRAIAYRRAADVVAGLSEAELRDLLARDWRDLAGVGPSTGKVIAAALAGEVPATLAELRAAGAEPLTSGGAALRSAQRGDLHLHTTWSDGSASMAEMVACAEALGHEWLAITDHSPRLRVANGLSAERLRAQLAEIEALAADRDGEIRILRGIEADIRADGSLDQDPELLADLDVVVASVHSHLRADAESMTHRMVRAIANPRTNVLGHCTGRLVEGERGLRPPSVFDAEVVFEACRQFDVAVEINSRPERCDPPDELLRLAAEMGCLFAINTDAHAPGQLEFFHYGCARAQEMGIPADRIITTWSAGTLLDWIAGG
ncbi:PHP domain-containing protein [Enemella sp. A6]|uniref:PHP domain-containing protein n=1 Tax=Enemella sp. A6 TaxID=3440152 RepID=UPI003EBA2AED